jgi:hypothetical protein
MGALVEIAHQRARGLHWQTAFNVLGLVLNLMGVILLSLFGMPFRIRTGGHSFFVSETSDPKDAIAERWAAALSWLGLAFIVLGTTAQIVASIR